jgi:tetratricopeptide (TPR) repeat protein
MSMSHYTEDELSAYSLRPDSVMDRERLGIHLASCSECREALALIEEFDAALHDPLPWNVADNLPDPSRPPGALLSRARAIAAADATARELIEPLVRSAIRFREARIEHDERFHTASVVRLLCNAANGMHERQPDFGLLLADTALTIAASLDGTATPCLGACTGTAWKERANALRFLGRFKEAEEALDRAVDAFHTDLDVEPFDLAIIDYVRATVCAETERFEESVRLARQAAGQFLVYGDQRRYLSARLVEGFGYYSADRHREAAPIFESVVSSARAANELWILAGALANAASCYTQLREGEKARTYYSEALSVFTVLDVPTESARIRWAVAASRVESGDLEQGLQSLTQAREELIQLGLTNDASLATLDLAAGLLASGQPDQVASLCHSIAVTFASEGVTRSAQKALAYLREAVTSGDVTPEGLRDVRTFLERLPARPRQEFLPLR